MAKVAKQTQTDYTRGGKAISDTAIPLYQENLNRMGEYLADPMAAQNKYLQEYFTNTPDESDFLRNYNRAMSARTGQNYASTGGGFSSANQQGYDDLQRYMNDYAARLRAQGVTSAYNMANTDYANMVSANNSYNAAYGLGKPYSDVEQWNYMAKQANGAASQIGSSLGTVGAAIGGAYGGPLGALAGNAVGNSLGGMMTTQMPGMSTVNQSSSSDARQLAGIGQGAYNITNALSSLFGKGKRAIWNWSQGLSSTGQGVNTNVGDFPVNNDGILNA